MTVVAFPKGTAGMDRDWRAEELQQLVALFAAHAGNKGAAISWDIGVTECGDPQFYLLGPAPNFECLLCCSRLEARYVLENGTGGVLAEEPSLRQAMRKAAGALAPRRGAFVARVLVLITTFRVTIEQKLEPVMAESSEWLGRFAPQLAALA